MSRTAALSLLLTLAALAGDVPAVGEGMAEAATRKVKTRRHGRAPAMRKVVTRRHSGRAASRARRFSRLSRAERPQPPEVEQLKRIGSPQVTTRSGLKIFTQRVEGGSTVEDVFETGVLGDYQLETRVELPVRVDSRYAVRIIFSGSSSVPLIEVRDTTQPNTWLRVAPGHRASSATGYRTEMVYLDNYGNPLSDGRPVRVPIRMAQPMVKELLGATRSAVGSLSDAETAGARQWLRQTLREALDAAP